MALLLAEGLADTVRVSLTAPPEKEVFVAWQILQALGLRRRGATFVSCPTCGRCEVDMMAVAARVEKAVLALEAPLTVAVMGCTVNGPGEAKEADIGLACGRGGGVIFKGGKVLRKVPASRMADELISEVLKLASSLR